LFVYDGYKQERTTVLLPCHQLAQSVIESKLVQTIEDPNFDRPDSPLDYSVNDYAYDALWLLEIGGEIEEV
jgi:hypothetical protein